MTLVDVQRALSARRSMTRSEAIQFVRVGLKMIDEAISGAAGGFFIWQQSALFGEQTRANVRRELEALAAAHGAGGPQPLAAADVEAVKRAVLRAAVELNGVAEGREHMAAARSQLFGDLVKGLGEIIDAGATAIKWGVPIVAGLLLVALLVLPRVLPSVLQIAAARGGRQ